MGNTIQVLTNPDPYPETYGKSQWDSNYGFSGQREKRVIKATEEELIAAKVPADMRDYCAHVFLELLRCRRERFPMVQECRTELHHYHKCEYEDMVLRMKEYERERRLLIREQEKKAVTA